MPVKLQLLYMDSFENILLEQIKIRKLTLKKELD